MGKESGRRGYLKLVLPIAGLIFGTLAAILTIVVPSYVERWGIPFFGALFDPTFIGNIFGAVMAVFVCIFLRPRSFWRALSVVVASTFAYLVAWYITIFSSMYGGLMRVHEQTAGDLENTSVLAFVIGGTVGAFALLLPVLLLFSKGRRTPRVLLDLSVWTIAGGALGALGWAFGPSLGSVAASLFGYRVTANSGDISDSAYYCSIFLVWQAGMGLVLGLLFSREAVMDSAPNLRPTLSTRGGQAVIGFMALVLVFFGFQALPDSYRRARSRQESSKHIAETPSRENLRKVEPRPVEETLILNALGICVPGDAQSGETNSTFDESGRRKTPEAIMYAVVYRIPGDEFDLTKAKGYVSVRVEEYPNAAWAKFQILEQVFGKHTTEIKFGNKVEASADFPDKGEGYYLWSSRNFFVRLELHHVDPDPFLQAYLQKYPSSL